MSNPNCPECEGTGFIPCSLEYGQWPHPENCPSCGGDPTSVFPCPDCSNGSDRDEA